MQYRIPLSYNPIDSSCLQAMLQQYEDQHHNKLIFDFEEKLAALTRARYAVALNSGTAAIHLGLMALGVGQGDEVMVSTFTYAGSVNPILYLGATPVFIDSEDVTWNMDPGLLEHAIQQSAKRNRKPKAIIVVHAYGMPARMNEILSVARRYDIPVLEDAAEALGSVYQGNATGALADIGILSFNNNKIIPTYGGGALFTHNEEIYRQVILLASQSRANELFYHHEQVGFSYRMGPVNAAVGLSQLPLLADKMNQRRDYYERYRKGLEQRGFQFFNEPSGSVSNRWLTTVVQERGEVLVKEVVETLEAEGVEVRYLWNPMHRQPVFDRYPSFLTGQAEKLFTSGLCLPSGGFPVRDIGFVIQRLLDLTKP